MTHLDLSPLLGQHQADVVILGGGLAGLATAVELTRPGRRVALLEASSIGAGASGADLGHVATGLPMPYTKACAAFGRDEARTVWECHRESHERLRAVLAELGDDCGYRGKGGFVLARDRQEAKDLADSEDALRDDGFAGEFLDHYMLEARFQVRGFSGAYWAADDGEVDPVALLRRMAAFAASRGASLFEASQVRAIEIESGGILVQTARGELRAGLAVVALGAAAGSLLPAFGPGVASAWSARFSTLSAHRLTFRLASGPSLPSPARSTHGDLGFRVGRDLRVAAFSRPGALADAETVFGDLRQVADTHLGQSSVPLARWSGALLSTADGLPLVGPLDGLPVVVHLGLGSQGHSWAFAAAQWIAERLAGREGVPSLFRATRVPLRPPPSPPAERPS